MSIPVSIQKKLSFHVAALTPLLAVAPGLTGAALADSVNSPNITMNVDTNRSTGAGAGNVAVTVNTITIAETMLAEYSSGAGKAMTLRVRPGFQFDPTSNVTAQSATIGINSLAVNAVASVTPSGAANEQLTFNLTSGTNATVQDIIRINGVKLKILSAAGAAGPATTTLLLTTTTAGGAFTDQGLAAANITRGAADRLVFSVQPGTNQAGAALLPAVKIVDFGGNLINNDDRTITLALQSNPGSASLLGQTQHTTIGGTATWVAGDDLRMNVAANGYTLRASHSGAGFLSSDTVDSVPFDILPGAPTHLEITRQPVNTDAGSDILIDVTVKDPLGNVVTTSSVSVSIEAAVNPNGWPLLTSTSLTKATVNGVASWSAADDLRITKAITGYRLAASGVGMTAISNLFDITPATPNALRFVQQPFDVEQDNTQAPPVTVEIIDAFGNRTSSTANVSLALTPDSCNGNVANGTVAAIAGLATFDMLQIDRACSNGVLEASSGALVRANSDVFRVTGASPFGLPICGVCGAGVTLTVAPLLLLQVVLRGRSRRRRGGAGACM